MMSSEIRLLLFLCCVTGSAGLYCLSCVDGVSPRHCHTVRNCSDGEVCFTESHYSENREVVFDTGCGTLETCHSGRNTTHTRKNVHGDDPHYHHNICLECCSSDLCNSQGCGQPGYPAVSTRGPVCFDCQQVSHPMLCDKIRVCEKNQECHLQKEEEFGDVFYASSCINKHACILNLQIFGKRRSVSCSHCCQTDLCNINCGASFSSSPITTQTILTQPSTKEPLIKGSQGEEFLVLFMENYYASEHGYENAYILSDLEGWSSVNITSSPHLERAIKSNVDRIFDFTSYVNISFPYDLTCQDLLKETKAVIFKTSELSTVTIFDTYNQVSNDATLIIPTRKLSTGYLTSSSLSFSSQFAVGSLNSKTDLQIKFNISGNVSLTLNGTSFFTGDTFSISLEKFETIQIYHDADLSGTFVSANKPIAVFSGDRCAYMGYPGCSHAISQLPPIQEYDNEYIIPSFYQNMGTFIQVISPVENRANFTIGTSTSTLRFEAYEYHNLEIGQNQMAIVKSEHPVQVTAYAKGSNSNSPYMTVMPGINHYLDYYKIIVPENYTNNYLCVIIPRQSVDNLRINNLSVNKFTTSFQSVQRSIGKMYSIPILSVSQGVYVLKTTDKVGFGLLVYGHRPYDGYGYAGNFVLP